VLILANGASGAGQITIAKEDAFEKFTSALFEITKGLARMIVKDGEGATKLIEVNVAGAKDPTDARLAAKAVCNSPLVKTAIYGEDANWGRIASAVGASGSKVDINSLSVYFGNCKVLNNGRPAGEDEKALKGVLAQKEIKITVDLGMGDSAATMWTCDFSEGYIRINAKYGT
jgi:glutamate N-acetyltransferase/amino-acid N-acetyltransferase